MSDKIISRAYNTFTDVPYGLLKKESKTSRLADELLYYRAIQNDPNRAIFFPRLLGGAQGNPNWLLIEKYGYPTLGDLMLSEKDIDWKSIFEQIIPILIQFNTFSDWRLPDGNPEYIKEMYITKTETEYENLLKDNDPYFTAMLTKPDLEINNILYKNYNFLWNNGIKQYIIDHLLSYQSVMIHGDFCFSNILYGGKGIFKFIDMRGSFGSQGIYGDQRYDIAKLYHSAKGGYEWLNADRFWCNGDGTQFQLGTRSTNKKLIEIFESIFFPTFNKKEITIITACIFIGAAARHYENPLRQRALYLTGVILMNEAWDL